MIAAHMTEFWRSRHLSRRPAAFLAVTVLYIIVILVAAPEAQPPAAFPFGAPGTSTPIRDAASGSSIDLLVGRSTVLNVGSTITRVSLTVPDVADAMVTAPAQLLIHGKQPGTISLFVWDKGGSITTYEVTVRRDLSALKDHLRQLFPGENITVLGSGTDVVLSGTVAGQYVIEKAAEVAGGYVEKKENVVNLLKQQEGIASNQVMLRVRFAEVSRSALQELGASFFMSARNNRWYGRTTTGQFPAPDFDSDREGRVVFSDFLNLFVFNVDEGLGGVVRALQNRGLFQSLAEPNLIATNGREASFLAGGEYPYPVVQPGSGGAAVTIMFKEFGVRLNFTPTVLGGDLIHLKVRPEVSSLDFSNALTLSGFRVPAISTRRTETEVELRDGQTFAIAGLLNNSVNSTMQKIPGIGDIPVLGLLFRSKAHQKNQTELVVMITPTIIRRGQMGVSEGLPTMVEPFLGRPDRSIPVPDPYVGSPRYPVTHTPGRDDNNNAPVPSAAHPSMPAPVPQMPFAAPEAGSLGTVPVIPMLPPTPAELPAPQPLTPAALPEIISPVATETPAAPAPVTVPQRGDLAVIAPRPEAPPPQMPSAPGMPSEGPMQPVGFPPMPGSESPQPPTAPPHRIVDGPQPQAQTAYPPMPPGFNAGPSAPASVAGVMGSEPPPAPLTKAQMKAIEKARARERKEAEAEAKRRAAEDKRRTQR